ncbi:MAG: aspartate/glutamate racemase family protein [Gordonia sp. (in: high G+C Gram-positive bacteria)]
MKIVVMNCNTTDSMTADMANVSRKVASANTEIIALQPYWGPESAEGYFDSFLTATAVLDRIEQINFEFDALVMAGFGEHGREGARELLSVPVVDVTEAGPHLAMMLGHRYGVVTTLQRAVPQIADSLQLAGLMPACASIQAADLRVLEVDADRTQTLSALEIASRRALSAGSEVIVLGCAGMTDLRGPLSLTLGVPVIDSVEAAVRIAESLVALDLRTSKSSAFAAPLPKSRPGWPISQPNGTRRAARK